MEQFVERWPDNADALGMLAQIRIKHSSADSGSARFGAERARAIAAARRALAIDPRNAAALPALSQTGSGDSSLVEASPLVARATPVDPAYPAALSTRADVLVIAGFFLRGTAL